MRRIAPPDNDYSPHENQVHALKAVVQTASSRQRVPFATLAYAYASIKSDNALMSKPLPQEDFVFFYQLVNDIGKSQNSEPYNDLTPQRFEEARTRLKRLAAVRETRIWY